MGTFNLHGWIRTNIDVVTVSGSADLNEDLYTDHISSSGIPSLGGDLAELQVFGDKLGSTFTVENVTLPYETIPAYDNLNITWTGSLLQSACDSAHLKTTGSFNDVYRIQLNDSSHNGYYRDWVNGVIIGSGDP